MLGIVIVDYKNEDLTIRFVKKELAGMIENIEAQTIIVCNCASRQAIEKYRSWLDVDIVAENGTIDTNKTIHLIPVKENLGFAKGNNLGVQTLARNYTLDYLLFSNTDIEAIDPDVVQVMLSKMSLNEIIGIIGPKVVGLDGRCQSPEPFRPMSQRYVWMYLASPFMSKVKKTAKFHLDYSENAKEGFHYKVMGSFFMMRYTDFKAVGGMDPNTFLYAEEVILSEKLKKISKGVYYCPSASVLHAHGATTHKNLKKHTINKIQADSEKYYYTTYCGVPFWKAELCIAVFHSIQWLKSLLSSRR
ncbi:MAG: glycosyltransferase family 2 protein [Muribaculum sp.]|nr:glycosyltransferase family 2 protein [Muribaculum sp.]